MSRDNFALTSPIELNAEQESFRRQAPFQFFVLQAVL